MYREGPDPLLVTPDGGLRGIWVGSATPSDVLEVFGSDAKVDEHRAGEVYQINFDYSDDDDYEAGRPAQESRPSKFHFEFGLLKAIGLGVYQTALYTTGGVRIRSTRQSVVDVFGAEFVRIDHDDREIIRYLGHGIEFHVSTDDDFGVTAINVFRKRR